MEDDSSFFIIILLLSSFTFSANSQSDSCAAQLTVGDLIPFSTSSLACVPAWTSERFFLRYAKTGPSLWSFVLSAPDGGAYVAIGFSPDGRMVGSSAVVGWMAGDGGAGMAVQYFLGGYSPDQCPPEQGNLTLVRGSPVVVSRSSRLYLAFQLNASRPEGVLVYAVGPENALPSAADGYLATHRSMASGSLNAPAADRGSEYGSRGEAPSGGSGASVGCGSSGGRTSAGAIAIAMLLHHFICC
ncbi:cytochrome b561 and DOMON domain-containing protein At3g07570-like [Zingiber officinale]|uniref:DOMON domain-containing protein n=1 Tax=Zingiber officinale TaxID=94328 RepID=A0A8J5F9E6_ZINOF|nr:cytochrome b561 and DOMON domain-containing protein At3g07570-like [Zingiber officinale]KAG6482909.1 hypothetical protein ZIOFF_059548 [Zingiber officinale]